MAQNESHSRWRWPSLVESLNLRNMASLRYWGEINSYWDCSQGNTTVTHFLLWLHVILMPEISCLFNTTLHNKINLARRKSIYYSEVAWVITPASLGELLSIGRSELAPSVVSKASPVSVVELTGRLCRKSNIKAEKSWMTASINCNKTAALKRMFYIEGIYRDSRFLLWAIGSLFLLL